MKQQRRITRLISVLLVLTMTLTLAPCVLADTDSAAAEMKTLDVNGSSASVEVYSINGEDYVSLRDIAALMNGTDSQFSVSYDTDSSVVSVVLGEAYVADGSELDGDGDSASYVPSTWSLQVNGVALDIAAYEIDGDNFYRLSDIGNAVGMIIEYDDNGTATKLTSGGYSLVFDSSDYELCTYTFDDGTEMQYRFYEGIVYCSNPTLVDYEVLNIYVPAGFYDGDGTVNGYTVDTAPIYNPNGVGGYLSTTAPTLENRSQGAAMAYALSMGYVCVTAAARGNNSTDEDGNFVGLAPAGLVDLKAAIRYLRFNDAVIPGDTEKIISNGLSAGGGMSSLLSVTGNSEDYTKYLNEINAADTRDDVFAGVCFCNILDLENLNEAYEWLFSQTGATTYAGKSTWSKNTDGTPIEMSDAELALSEIFCSIYIEYINGMNLKNPETGEALYLNEDGSGPYYDYLEQLIIEAAQEELDKNGTLVSNNYGDTLVDTFTVEDGKVTDVDMSTYLNTIQRLTGVGAMDNGFIEIYKDGVYTGLVQTNEAKLFAINGLSEIVHFDSNLKSSLAAVIEQGYTFEALEKNGLTVEDFAVTEGLDPNDPESIVYIMNPMHYVDGTKSDVAPHIYVWQGACDNDVTLATAVSFGTAIYTGGACEDLRIKYQWDQKHGGNYEIEEMFDWLESFCSVDESDETDMRTLDVNGSSVSVKAYSIDDEDYFSLRDIAELMNGTDSQFSVSYDADSCVVSVVLGEAYVADDSELDGDGDSTSYVPSTWSLQVNGVTLDVAAYEIGGDNFYKLSDISNAVGIIVEYDDDGIATKLTSGGYSLVFDSSVGEQRTTEFKGNTITYTAYEDIVYCTNPCLIDNQMMNVYIPEGCDENSPIFIINSSGGYSKSTAAKDTSELFTYAVGNGYVCVTLGCRGQRATIDNGDGTYSYVGRAPATIVDFKAGIRYLKFNDNAMSGDIEKIIMDGHSSGGGTTALIGLSANDPAYSSYLQEINAADTSDDIYACICFAPVFNLESSDIAYEWQNNGINTTIGAELAAIRDNLGLYHNENLNEDGAYEQTEEEIALSDALAGYFPEYINDVLEDLGLDMSLSEDGKSGTLVDYLTELVEAEYTRGLGLMSEGDAEAYVNGTGEDKASVDRSSWLSYSSTDGAKITSLWDFFAYVGRLKSAPAFDGKRESNVFGEILYTDASETHFDPWLYAATGDESYIVSDTVLEQEHLYSVFDYLVDDTENTTNWYIRYGTIDNGVYAYPPILAAALQAQGLNVDFRLEFEKIHQGNYELDDVFAWLASIDDSSDEPAVTDGPEVTVSTTTSSKTITVKVTSDETADFTVVLTDEDGEVVNTQTDSGTSATVKFTGLTNGEEYTITVTAVNSEGGETTVTKTATPKGTSGGSSSTSTSGVATTGGSTTDDTTSTGTFTDVSTSAYYYDAVEWAVANGITTGTSDTTFSPEIGCSRAQIVTFLWRDAGSPEAEGENPFTDVATDAYYYDAILWAVANGITNGTTDTTFSPDDTCTRGQIVTFLYRYAGASAEATATFSDVDVNFYYAAPVAWAVANGITNGTSDTTFSPDDACTRAQVVTFLYRYEAV